MNKKVTKKYYQIVGCDRNTNEVICRTFSFYETWEEATKECDRANYDEEQTKLHYAVRVVRRELKY